MPFTVTHTLAVVPLRHRLPFAALIVGSMVPDFPLYYPIGIDYFLTHSASGIVLVCLPLGLALYALWMSWLREPAVALLPRWWRLRLWPRKARAPAFAAVAVAIVVGACTHVAWDAFTHVGRWGTRLVPALGRTFELGPLHAHGYSYLQHGSSVIGLPLLALLAWRATARLRPLSDTPPLKTLPRALVVTLLLVVSASTGAVAYSGAGERLAFALQAFVKTGGCWFSLLLLAFATAWHARPGWFIERSPPGRVQRHQDAAESPRPAPK